MAELNLDFEGARESWRAERTKMDDRGGATSSRASSLQLQSQPQAQPQPQSRSQRQQQPQPSQRQSTNSVSTLLDCGGNKENQPRAAPVKPRNMARRRDMSPTRVLSNRKPNGNQYISASASNPSYPISLPTASFQPSAPSAGGMHDGPSLAETRRSCTFDRTPPLSTLPRGTTVSDESCNPYDDSVAPVRATPGKISETMPPLRSAQQQVSYMSDVTNVPLTDKRTKRESKNRFGASHDNNNMLTVGNIHLHDALHTNQGACAPKREIKEHDEVVATDYGGEAQNTSIHPFPTQRATDSSKVLPAQRVANISKSLPAAPAVTRRCTVESSGSSTIAPVRGVPIQVASAQPLPPAHGDAGATRRANDVPTPTRDFGFSRSQCQRQSADNSSRAQYGQQSGGESSRPQYMRQSSGEYSQPQYQRGSGGGASQPHYQRESGSGFSQPRYQRGSGGESLQRANQRGSGGEFIRPQFRRGSGGESSNLRNLRQSGGELSRWPRSTEQRQQQGSMNSSYVSYGSASRSDSADNGRRAARRGERDERYAHGTQRGMRSSPQDPPARILSLSSLTGHDESDDYTREAHHVYERKGSNRHRSTQRLEYRSRTQRSARDASIPRPRRSSCYTEGDFNDDDDLYYAHTDRRSQRWTTRTLSDRLDRYGPPAPLQRERVRGTQRRSYRDEYSVYSDDTYSDEDVRDNYYSDEHCDLESDGRLSRRMTRGMEARMMIEDERGRRWEVADDDHSDWEGAKLMVGEQWDDARSGIGDDGGEHRHGWPHEKCRGGRSHMEDSIIELVPKRCTVRLSEDTQVQVVKAEYSLAQEELAQKEQPRSKENKWFPSSLAKKWESATSSKTKSAGPNTNPKPVATINSPGISVQRNQFDPAEGISNQGIDMDDAVDARKSVLPHMTKEPEEITGYLEKQVRKSFIPRWHRRYFQLSKGILQYYRDPSMTEIRKTIDFHKCVANVTETDGTIQIVMEPMQGLTSMEEQTNLNLASKDEAETSQWVKLLKQHILFACVENARWFLNRKDSRIKVPTYEVLGHDGVEIYGPYTVGQIVEMMWDKTIHPEALVKRNDETSFRALGAGGETERRLVQQWSHIASEGVRTRVTRQQMNVNLSTLATTPSYWVSSCGSEAELFDLVTDPALRDVFDHVIMWSKKKYLRIHQVQRVENGRIWHQYAKALRQAADKDALDGAAMPPEMEALPAELLGTYRLDLNEFLVWYGTTSHEARSLARTGFRDVGTRKLTDCAWKSDEHSAPDATGTFALVGCRVVCGRVFTDPSKRAQQGLASLLTEVQADTLLVPQKDINGWWRSLHVLEARRIYPEYVVLYTR